MSPSAGNEPPATGETPGAAFPVAATRESRWTAWRLLRDYGTRYWWLTLVCVIVTAVLVASATGHTRLKITVIFGEGHGIKPGDALRHLGIEIGRIRAVELGKSLDEVHVSIAIEPRAEGIAREGSQFWIERPRVSLSGVSGLETVVGAKYIGVRPGPSGAARARLFRGLETPPTLTEPAAVEITIRFRNGHGLAVSDLLRHRGIVVGEVTALHLEEDLAGVVARVQLVESARRLARAGSQFWIERPRLSLAEVGGLDTIVGGRYLAVLPGPPGAEPLEVFDGLDRPPAVPDRAEGGLEIVLESSSRSGLEPGSPVTYRGIQIGRITSVGLSSDAGSVESRAYIQPGYRLLVRDNTEFWSISGLDFQMGWTGVRMDLESLTTFTAGGVALGTREPPGSPVTTGKRFPLRDKPSGDPSEWKPSIPIGSTVLPDGRPLPQPARASLRWRERSYGLLTRERQRDAWLLPLEGSRLIGPADLLLPVEGAIDDRSVLALGGKEFPVTAETSTQLEKLALYTVGEAVPGLEQPWPLDWIRTPAGTEDCILVGDPKQPALPLSAGRITVEEDTWKVDPSMPLDETWHGAAVVSRRDGSVIGLLLLRKGRASIVPLSREEIAS